MSKHRHVVNTHNRRHIGDDLARYPVVANNPEIIHETHIAYQTSQLESRPVCLYLQLRHQSNIRSQTMTTATRNPSFFQAEKAQKAPLTLAAIVAAVFMVKLRESLDAATGGDKSDAAFAYGL
jgi:hypothetical protein